MVWGGVGVEVVFVLVRLLVIGGEVMGVAWAPGVLAGLFGFGFGFFRVPPRRERVF